jgi:hypothetical protein
MSGSHYNYVSIRSFHTEFHKATASKDASKGRLSILGNKYKRTGANIKSYRARMHKPELPWRVIACMTATIEPSLEVYHIEIGDYSFSGPEIP